MSLSCSNLLVRPELAILIQKIIYDQGLVNLLSLSTSTALPFTTSPQVTLSFLFFPSQVDINSCQNIGCSPLVFSPQCDL